MSPKMSSDAEMKGSLVLASLNTLRKDEISHLLEEAKTYTPNEWYSVAHVREMLEDVVAWRKSIDGMFDLVSMGASVTQSISLPPEWDTLEKALINYSTYHQQFYRNTGLDWLIKAEVAGERCMKIRFRINIPDHFMYGWLWGFAKRLLPKGTQFEVKFDENSIPADAGGEETMIWVKWEKPPE